MADIKTVAPKKAVYQVLELADRNARCGRPSFRHERPNSTGTACCHAVEPLLHLHPVRIRNRA